MEKSTFSNQSIKITRAVTKEELIKLIHESDNVAIGGTQYNASNQTWEN